MRVIDNSRLRVRHIKRAAQGTPGAVQVLGSWWAPASVGIEGRQGWQSANVERRVSDHGALQSMALPNAAGDDGQLHRDRFAVRTDPAYRLGTEWIEFRDEDSGRPLFVGTPDSARVDGSTVALTGVDAAGLLAGFREGKVAPWTPHGPLDVIDWYSRAPQQLAQDDFREASGLHGWNPLHGGTGSATSTAAGLVLAARGAGSPSATITRVLDGPDAGAAWTATARFVLGSADVGGFVQLSTGGCQFEIRYPTGSGASANLTVRVPYTGSTYGYVQRNVASAPFVEGEAIELTIVAIDGWIIFLRDGAVVAQLRRRDYAAAHVTACNVSAFNANITLQTASWATTRAFLRRGAPAPDYRVAGAPTPGGLRGDYFLTYDEWVRSSGSFADYGAQVPAPLAEPYQRRLDPTINFSGAPPTWQPPGPPNGEGFAVRWSGSIYLDLDNPGRYVSLDGVDDMARVWIGKSGAGQEYVGEWGVGGAGTVDNYTESLQQHLGTEESGWFPIVIEYAQGPSGGAGLRLQTIAFGGSSWTVVPATQLSPYGCWEGDLGNESHREAIDGVATSMGLRWRVQPMTLESGEFPGRLEVGGRLGTDTDYQLGEDEATEYASEVAAAEAVDRILADAAGLGDNMGREGLTAEVLDPSVIGQPWVTTRYESLGDITEDTMLRQRLSSLLALYGSPMETVAARPRGQDELVREFRDAFPLVGTARLFLWEPDDGIRLVLPTIGVEDQAPRAITSVAWPLTPDGRGAPAVGFRQRPKHLRATLQRLMRQSAVSRRHYQGQLSELSGSIGSVHAANATDQFSRLYLPPGRTAKLAVRVIAVASGTLEVNGVSTGLAVTRGGEYDVTAWAPPAGGFAYARVAGAGTDATVQLVATVRV